MHIRRAIITNYKCLRSTDIEFNSTFNILVGNNECGKSTVIEAVNLALTGQLNGRAFLNEAHPFLFNVDETNAFLAALIAGGNPPPPKISIELFFDAPDAPRLRGSINSRKEDTAGVTFNFEFDDSYGNAYTEYIKTPKDIRTIPIEYYRTVWRSFAGENITARSIPFIPALIDASNIRSTIGANRYVLDVVKNILSMTQRVQLALSYRGLRDRFLDDVQIKGINVGLASKKDVSDKTLSVSLDSTARASWEAGIMPHLDEIPLPLAGKGEQNSVKIKLAIDADGDTNLILLEEPENHLSHTRLNALISRIREKAEARQVILTTHSSFVMNKLGVDHVHMFNGKKAITLSALKQDTKDYFLKLPGYDTLRLILADRAVLVEGPSDELIYQKAFCRKHGRLPIEQGIEVIAVSGLAFKRFLEIAELLGIQVSVLTDNDGDVVAVEKKYADFKDKPGIQIQFDTDEDYPTLEPQLLKANGRALINEILGTTYATDDELLKHMKANKTDCALAFFSTEKNFVIPTYIANAVP
jgi:predicted ATPase